MKDDVVESFSNLYLKKYSVITIGKFDGVHLGHQKLLKTTVEIAEKNDMFSIAILFSKGCNNLHTLEENIELIKSFGINYIIVIDFSDKFYKMSGEEFFYKLIQYYNMRYIVVGSDFRYGVNRSGDVSNLFKSANDYNSARKSLVSNDRVRIKVLSSKMLNGEKVSTTAIIRALSEGKITLAKKMLGRYYSITSKVFEGKKLGRTIGYPTANLYVGDILNIPKEGVYFSLVNVLGKEYEAMTFIGNSKINDHGFRLESYMFNFNKTIYGKEVTVTLLKYSRENVRVDSVNELKTLLKRDEIEAYNYFKRRKRCLQLKRTNKK